MGPPLAKGIAIADFAYDESEESYIYNVFVADSAPSIVLAHELGHLLTDAGHTYLQENLMVDGPSSIWLGSVLDSKRLTQSQEQEIRSDSHVQ